MSLILGKNLPPPKEYDKTLLFPISREEQRRYAKLEHPFPYNGVDVWNLYELSWLNPKGKPQTACGKLTVPGNSPFLIESKSLKFYLASLHQKEFDSPEAFQKTIEKDLSDKTQAPVTLSLFLPSAWEKMQRTPFQGTCLDTLDISCDAASKGILKKGGKTVSETHYSHLFKCFCPVTGQPDYATIQISYYGKEIRPASLLGYLLSYRNHQGFHEECVERIFEDIYRTIEPEELTVGGYFLRRGGIDICPIRSISAIKPSSFWHYRQ